VRGVPVKMRECGEKTVVSMVTGCWKQLAMGRTHAGVTDWQCQAGQVIAKTATCPRNRLQAEQTIAIRKRMFLNKLNVTAYNKQDSV